MLKRRGRRGADCRKVPTAGGREMEGAERVLMSVGEESALVRGRMPWRYSVALSILSFMLVPGAIRAEDQPNVQALIAAWKEQNTLCRGLHGDDPRTQPACDERQRLGRALYERGWCYGEENQLAYQMQWHRCHANSVPY